MLYLLDADSLIRASNTFYRLNRVPQFWEWLLHQGALGKVTIPTEQFEEVVAGKGALVDWLRNEKTKSVLKFDEEADPTFVAKVVQQGYGDLDEYGVEAIGRDPFLISYAFASKTDRCVVTFESSAPSKKGKNRKIPDVCKTLDVSCGTLFDLIEALDFRTDWKPD